MVKINSAEIESAKVSFWKNFLPEDKGHPLFIRDHLIITQLTFTCSKSAIEKGVKYVCCPVGILTCSKLTIETLEQGVK